MTRTVATILIGFALVASLAGCGSDDFASGVQERADLRAEALLVMLAAHDDLTGPDGDVITDEVEALLSEVDLVEAVRTDRLQDLIDLIEHDRPTLADVLDDVTAILGEESST